MSLIISDFSVSLGGRPVVSSISVTVSPGTVLGIVGPNGSGKSSLIRGMLGLLPTTSGSVTLDGAQLLSMRPRKRAGLVAAVLQDASGDFDLTCHDVVAMGRAPHKKLFDADLHSDTLIIQRALDCVNARHFGPRPFASLSGGERQRILIARAIAQEPQLLIMDEPTNHLDIKNQFDVLAVPGLLGVTAVIALHDLNLAAEYCDQILLLDQGHVVGLGDPSSVLSIESLERVYGVRAEVIDDAETGKPFVRFRREWSEINSFG